MTDVLMPALSPTMEEGTLAKWLVKAGDKVRAGDVIAEIETDKATMEVEAVDEGVVGEILVPEGTEGVKVNAPIARLLAEGESPAAGTPAPVPADKPAPVPEPAATAPPPQPRPEPVKTEPAATPAPAAAKISGASRILASPLARRLAAQKGVDLSALKGSGPHGRIIRRDVEGAPASAATAAAPAPVTRTEAPQPAPAKVLSLEQLGIPPGSYELVPLDGMRKTVARRLTEAFRDIPHFPLTIDVTLDALLAARAQINTVLEPTGVKVSVNDLVIKASALALKRAPEVNASFTPQGIAYHKHADVAVAVAVEGGLITPIIREAELKGLAAIATEMKDLAERARTRKLKPEEYQGGTFSVSNLGMFGIRSFASILNPPQGAILSVGAGEKRPVVVGDELKVATVMTVTLTCDHRVIGGAEGAKFLSAFKGFVEQPLAMLA